MMTALDHPLVVDYLHRLHLETVRLPVLEAHELETDIRSHLGAALGDAPTEAEVRQTIDRLGTPTELVEAAGGGDTSPDPAAWAAAGGDRVSPPDRGSGGREAAAIVLLLGSALLFVLWPLAVPMWVAGLVLVMLGRRWDVGDKVRAGVVLGSALPLVLLVFISAGLVVWSVTECVPGPDGAEVCTSSGGGAPWVGYVVLALLVVYVVVLVRTTVRLVRSSRRADQGVTA
ncbi:MULTISPECIES: hypothetical protein [unclassified Ornithinimicrobium]|uniref:hypothetical protein n=1 Tax=unclassified Ornithinimicrobium TaxID=2615080 RepID=UPI003852CBB2